jgi:hypothetical protein
VNQGDIAPGRGCRGSRLRAGLRAVQAPPGFLEYPGIGPQKCGPIPLEAARAATTHIRMAQAPKLTEGESSVWGKRRLPSVEIAEPDGHHVWVTDHSGSVASLPDLLDERLDQCGHALGISNWREHLRVDPQQPAT